MRVSAIILPMSNEQFATYLYTNTDETLRTHARRLGSRARTLKGAIAYLRTRKLAD